MRRLIPRGLMVSLVCLGWGVWNATPAPTPEPQAARPLNRPAFQPTPDELASHRQALDPLHARYNERERMLSAPFSSPGYHTTLKGGTVHSTRTALEYAIALLDTLEDRWLPRAEAILRRVISLQDQNPASRTYGIWPWFLEEPLEKMSPPDWNWADFCGRLLLQAALDHRHRLSADVMREVDAAIQHAARAIKKRNVGPSYTNIAIMGAYVTLMAGELYGWQEMRDYGRARWRAFHEHTKKHGSFNEYNSPTYTVVAIEELGRLLKDAPDPELRQSIAEIYHLAWEEIAVHFHPPSRQWAGPHSRSYRTLLSDTTLSFIQRGSGGQLSWGANRPALSNVRLPLPCPPDLLPHFRALNEPRELRRQFVAGDPPLVGATWLQPEFTLGTINRGDLWNQRRSLVAYWGTAQKPAYLHLRLLRDGYDFAAAQFFCAQQRGRALAGIVFATDGGGTHVSLDRLKDGKVRGKDLRLRLEFGGAAAATTPLVPTALTAATVWESAGLWCAVQTPVARFGHSTPRWQTGREGELAWLDLILWESGGQEAVLDLTELSSAGVVLAIELAAQRPALTAPASRISGEKAAVTWEPLRVELPLRPARVRDLHNAANARVEPQP